MNKKREKFKYFVLVLVITFACATFVMNNFTYAETAEELRQQIEKTNQSIADLDKEIKKYQNQIAETAEQAKTLSNLIKELNYTRSKLIKEKELTEVKIQATNLAILKISGNINEQEKSIDNSRETLTNLIQELNRYDNEMFLERIFLRKNLAELSNDYNNIITLNENIRQYVNDLEIKKHELNQTKDQKEEENEKLNYLKQTLSQKAQAVLVSKKEKDKVLAETKNQESEYKKILLEKQKAMDAFERTIEEYEAKLKVVLNPESITKIGHGVLSWPLNDILVTSRFGERYISGQWSFHSGVDFRAAVGTSVKSMGDGVVEATGDTDIACKGASLGKWVFIKHDNGLSSSYGHLSSILVKSGTRVKSGQVIALSGNTGVSTGPHLHVSVFASSGVEIGHITSQQPRCNKAMFKIPLSTAQNARLDPLLYLPKTTADMFKK